jgi:hypothetical protein
VTTDASSLVPLLVTKMQSPLLGFNNNVRHKGRLFHIQTEDSGIRHPHVITHLFMDGGRILKTIKTSYAEHVGNDRLAEVVRELMKAQHKTMFIALRDGQFDRIIDGDEASKSGERPAAGRSAASIRPSIDPGPMPVTSGEVISTSSLPPRGTSGRREAPDLFGAPSSDSVSVVTHEPTEAPPESISPAQNRPSSGRYAASRPAAIFASNRPSEASGSLFGDDLINEKSLDEVILNYLSEDLDQKAIGSEADVGGEDGAGSDGDDEK